jgi:GTP-binding protein
VKVLAAERVASCGQAADLPRPGLPEIAFLGRSNVGKSSLLNRLAGRRKLAQTSNAPGRTRRIDFYHLRTDRKDAHSRELLLVDLPGYGYARVSQQARESWKRLVESYLDDRPSLRAAVLLQDLRRDPSEDETLLLAWLAERGVPALVAATKCDKCKPGQRAARLRALRKGFAGAPVAAVVPTSAASGLGLRDLWREILTHL